MTRQEAIWHANHVFNIVIERCINAQNLKDAREFDEAKQIVIEALQQESKWVSVTKALPIKGVKVLVQSNYPNLTYVAEIGSLLSQPEGWRTADGYERIEQTVAWMPLPEPYEEIEQ